MGLEKLQNNLRENSIAIQNLEMGQPDRQRKYQMYQQIRDYIRDLLECLNEKVFCSFLVCDIQQVSD